ncbi:hypothetical protein EC991_011353 [Linnemannia zychae]|nr:hypothetical protein EC991_011353 [Linnemannia zychae]
MSTEISQGNKTPSLRSTSIQVDPPLPGKLINSTILSLASNPSHHPSLLQGLKYDHDESGKEDDALLSSTTGITASRWKQQLQGMFSDLWRNIKSLKVELLRLKRMRRNILIFVAVSAVTVATLLEGDIFVTQRVPNNQESNDTDFSDDKVRIEITAMASSNRLLRAITLNSITNPSDSLFETSVYLQFPGDQEDDREVYLRKNCIRANIGISFPANLSRYESLKIQNLNKGDVTLRMPYHHGVRGGKTAASTISLNTNALAIYNYPTFVNTISGGATEGFVMDRLDVRTDAGNVVIKNLEVSDELRLVSLQDSVMAQVVANKLVVMESKRSSTLFLTSNGPNLDAQVSAEESGQVVIVKEEILPAFFLRIYLSKAP